MEASYFAMCLLIPRKLISEDLIKMASEGKDLLDDKHLVRLADKYQVPIMVMTNRIRELLNEDDILRLDIEHAIRDRYKKEN